MLYWISVSVVVVFVVGSLSFPTVRALFVRALRRLVLIAVVIRLGALGPGLVGMRKGVLLLTSLYSSSVTTRGR